MGSELPEELDFAKLKYVGRGPRAVEKAARRKLVPLDPDVAKVFADNGYATAIFGKWHLGDNYPFRPQDRGFQEVLVHGGGGIGAEREGAAQTFTSVLICTRQRCRGIVDAASADC